MTLHNVIFPVANAHKKRLCFTSPLLKYVKRWKPLYDKAKRSSRPRSKVNIFIQHGWQAFLPVVASARKELNSRAAKAQSNFITARSTEVAQSNFILKLSLSFNNLTPQRHGLLHEDSEPTDLLPFLYAHALHRTYTWRMICGRGFCLRKFFFF